MIVVRADDDAVKPSYRAVVDRVELEPASGFFEIDKKFNITPPITLAEFDVDFFRPPVLASEVNGDLILKYSIEAK